MLEMKLRKRDAPSYRTAVITFPANEPDLQKAMDEIGIGITTEKLCVVDAVQNEDKGLQALVGTLVNADEVQYLAKRMDSFDKNELHTFYGGRAGKADRGQRPYQSQLQPPLLRTDIRLLGCLRCRAAIRTLPKNGNPHGRDEEHRF